MNDKIIIKGAREHNLKNINIDNKPARTHLRDSSISEKINRGGIQEMLDWNLERSYWSDDIFDYDYFEDYESEMDDNLESGAIEKLTIVKKINLCSTETSILRLCFFFFFPVFLLL